MKKSLQQELEKMDTAAFWELRTALNLADQCRDVMITYKVPKEAMADKLGISIKELQSFLNGSYPYDLMIIAKLSEAKINLKLEHERENDKIIEFPPYEK